MKLPTGYDEVLDYFFYEYNIFLTHSFVESRELSHNFYAFFKQELELQPTLENKSAFLLHALRLTKEIKDRGSFDQQAIMETFSKDYISRYRQDISNYNPMQFSPLYENDTDSTNSPIGYYFFHKFIGNYQGITDTNVVLIEFSPYYEIQSVYQMDRPFAQYFNN